MKLLEAENISIGMAAQNSSAPEKLLVQEASFSLERGKTFGLLGSSGSGKTLLACALCGLLSIRQCEHPLCRGDTASGAETQADQQARQTHLHDLSKCRRRTQSLHERGQANC